MPTIRSLHNSLENLIEGQAATVKTLSAEMAKLSSAAHDKLTEARENIKTLIPADDDATFAQIGALVQQAGGKYDFPAMVATWRAEDAQNRAENKDLIAQWGDRKVVAQKTAVAQEELGIITEALGHVAPEIDAFDETTNRIAAHNAKYPKLQISEGPHDNYEEWRFWRWVGYYTFINRAPHHAYLAIGDYTKKYGDYYEDAADIAKLRENQEKLTVQQAEKQTELATITAIGERMDTLERTFKGPLGIVSEIRSRVYNFLTSDDDFTDILYNGQSHPAARQAALCVGQSQTLEMVKANLSHYHQHAANTLTSLKAPMDTLQSALHNVGSETVWFDIAQIENNLDAAARLSRQAAREAQNRREEIITFTPEAQETYRATLGRLIAKTPLETEQNGLSFDFSSLERKVRDAVEEYEAEQRRQREAREAAARALREQQRAAREAADRMRERRETRTSSITFNNSASRSSSSSVSRGSSGLGSRSTPSTSVSSGTRGLSGRRR